jgi:hypothetical protein
LIEIEAGELQALEDTIGIVWASEYELDNYQIRK